MSKKSEAKKQETKVLYAQGFTRNGDYRCVFFEKISQAKRRRLARGKHR